MLLDSSAPLILGCSAHLGSGSVVRLSVCGTPVHLSAHLLLAIGHWPGFCFIRVFIKSHTCSWSPKKNCLHFSLSSASMHINVRSPLGTYTIYSYDIFLYAHKCCAPNWRSFSGGEFISGHTKNKLKSTCHCLPLFAVAVCCLLFLLLSLYLFGPLISASILLFLFSWPRLLLCSYKCSLGSHWEHKEH